MIEARIACHRKSYISNSPNRHARNAPTATQVVQININTINELLMASNIAEDSTPAPARNALFCIEFIDGNRLAEAQTRVVHSKVYRDDLEYRVEPASNRDGASRTES